MSVQNSSRNVNSDIPLSKGYINTKMRLKKNDFSTGLFTEFNDPIEHATGLEKRELLAKLAGNNDPFHMDAIKRSATSSKEKPTLIPSAFEARIIGCVCTYQHPSSTSTMIFYYQLSSANSYSFFFSIIILQATKTRPMSTGCGCTKESQNVANAAIGLNCTRLHRCKIWVPKLVRKRK